jgi:predicted RNA-binding protein YlqC (UPF0109 family)
MSERLKTAVEYLVQSLVEFPDQVKLNAVSGEATTVFELRVAQSDLGKIIGKQGRTAQALRTLLTAASQRENRKASLEILE